MQTCTRCHEQSPDEARNCLNCQADLGEWSITAVALKKFQANHRVLTVRVITYHDCCPACAEMEGDYNKDDVPALPVQGCSHSTGCRCFYLPLLDEIYP